MARSWRRSPDRSSAGIDALFDDALVTQMDMGELAVAVLQIELDGAGRPGGAAADLGDAVLEAMRQVDSGAMLGPGNRISDRLASRFQPSGNIQPGATGLDIDLQIDRQK